jgi:hypothetical protein
MNLFTSENQSLKGNPKIKPNTIAIAVIDDREIIKHDLVRYLVETYTENTLFNLQKRRCDILGFFKETEIDDIIETSYKQNYELLVIIKTGTFINSSFFFENLKEMINNNIALMGHVLDYKESYYFLHEQCFFINLKSWKLSGSPQYFSTENNLINVDRSIDNFHDNYTPKWIKVGKDKKKYDKTLPGGYLISSLLESGYNVSPFKHERDLKFFTYHSDTMKSLMKFINLSNTKYTVGFFSTETETIKNIDLKDKNIDTVLSIASAFHPFKLVKKTNIESTLKNLIIYDYSPVAIDVYKNMLHVWDGKNYLSLLKNTKTFEFKAGHNEVLSEKSFVEMIELCNGNSDWIEYFNHICKLNKDFLTGNLISETFHKKITNKLEKDNICLFNVSNIFTYETETFWIDIFQRYFSFFNLYMLMKHNTKTTYFLGSLFNFDSLISTNDFTLEDFIIKSKELAITPWQKERLKDFESSLIKRYEDISNKNR